MVSSSHSRCSFQTRRPPTHGCPFILSHPRRLSALAPIHYTSRPSLAPSTPRPHPILALFVLPTNHRRHRCSPIGQTLERSIDGGVGVGEGEGSVEHTGTLDSSCAGTRDAMQVESSSPSISPSVVVVVSRPAHRCALALLTVRLAVHQPIAAVPPLSPIPVASLLHRSPIATPIPHLPTTSIPIHHSTRLHLRPIRPPPSIFDSHTPAATATPQS
ncbi:hypothetical protein DFP72DRAFT_312381 [Ephemerocybe angulata]|uniref:Uncharacterized protein n=1 Tax=Ephemerocybe angulata TaxID=980116 RepID=A0A8H6HZ55_9AGAR|nr:hypothetical protein DFP72DRAFT_312381 [Tulosesus angulatus]